MKEKGSFSEVNYQRYITKKKAYQNRNSNFTLKVTIKGQAKNEGKNTIKS